MASAAHLLFQWQCRSVCRLEAEHLGGRAGPLQYHEGLVAVRALGLVVDLLGDRVRVRRAAVDLLRAAARLPYAGAERVLVAAAGEHQGDADRRQHDDHYGADRQPDDQAPLALAGRRRYRRRREAERLLARGPARLTVGPRLAVGA